MKKLIVGGLSGMGLALAGVVGIGLHSMKKDRKEMMAKLDAFAKDKKFVAIIIAAVPEDAKMLAEREQLDDNVKMAKLVARLEFINEHRESFKSVVPPKKDGKKDGKKPEAKKDGGKKKTEKKPKPAAVTETK